MRRVFLAFALFGLLFGLDAPWTDDARFYVPAAASYSKWLASVPTGEAFSRASIDAAFRVNREHPPVAKYVMGVGWLVFHRGLGLDEITACRIPIVLLWALTAALVFDLVRRRTSLLAGVFASLAFALLPRVFFDGHAETLDMPVTAFITASMWALLRDLEAPRWQSSALTIGLFALALGTKLNAPFALLAALAFWLLTNWPRRDGTFFVLQPIPWTLVGMATLAPLLVLLLWPWLWFDTLARLADYARFHLQHYGILFYYGGHIYDDDVAPWSAPFVMAAMTLPLPVLTLAFFGLGKVRKVRLALFAALQALAQLAAVASPGTPVYGGVKLFLPAFPWIAVLAGLGFASLTREIVGKWRPLAAALLLLPGALGLFVYKGAWLSYYAEWVGGVRGAAEAGMETQYYDLAYPELAADLAAALPNGGAVAVLPNPKEYAPYFERWRAQGKLPKNLRLVPIERAELLVLTHERRWPRYPELQATYRTQPLVTQHSILGVPLYSIHRLVASSEQSR